MLKTRMRKRVQPKKIISHQVTKICKNHKVLVLTGKDKGKIGKVLEVQKGGQKVKVENVRLQTHYQKDDGVNKSGTTVTEGWIDISNVAHFTAEGKPTKVKIVEEEGVKKLYSRKTGELLETQDKDQKVQVEEDLRKKEKEKLKKEQFEAEKNTKEAGIISKKADVSKKKKGDK